MTPLSPTAPPRAGAVRRQPGSVHANANPFFLLRDLPTAADFLAMQDRYPDLDPELMMTFLALLHVTNDVIAMGEGHFLRAGISKGKFTVLMVLLAEDELTPSELANRIAVTRATITGLLDGLERDGLVRRGNSPDDRRKIIVKITPKAARLLDRFLPAHLRRIRSLFSGFSKADLRDLPRLLKKIREALPATKGRD